MEKKSIALIVAVILLFLGCYLGGQYLFAHTDEWIAAMPTGYTEQNPPYHLSVLLITLTNEDFTRYPALHALIEDGRDVPITEDPFLIMRSDVPCISKSDAAELLSSFGNGYLYWNKTYYHLTRVVT